MPTTEPDESDMPTTEPDESDMPTTEPDESDMPTTEPDEPDMPTTEPDEPDLHAFVEPDRRTPIETDHNAPAVEPPREIAIVVYERVQSLDVVGPLEVFSGTQRLLALTGRRERGYRVSVLSRNGAPVTTSSGLTLHAHASLGNAPARIDTLLVAGGDGAFAASAHDKALVASIAQAARRARRTASVCTGAFLLARAGLLDGRRATTHWAAAAELARRYPRVRVDAEPIYVRDGSVWTSAGVTAGMDLALALVEEDIGHDVALAVARQLVLFLRRPGGQSQFSATLGAQQQQQQRSQQRAPLREAQRFAVEYPAADLSVHAMAERAHMSVRHFARSFRAEVGVTPARYVEQVRVETARRLLEDTSMPVPAVAQQSGFGTAETLRRVLIRRVGVGPTEYRRRFQPAAGGRLAAA